MIDNFVTGFRTTLKWEKYNTPSIISYTQTLHKLFLGNDIEWSLNDFKDIVKYENADDNIKHKLLHIIISVLFEEIDKPDDVYDIRDNKLIKQWVSCVK